MKKINSQFFMLIIFVVTSQPQNYNKKNVNEKFFFLYKSRNIINSFCVN